MARRETLLSRAYGKFRQDSLGLVSFGVVACYALVALLVWSGVIATQWDELLGSSYAPVSKEFWFGATINGQDIFQRAIYSIKTAFEIGLSVAVLATLIGALAGVVMGYFAGSWLDELVLLIINSLDCIPYFLLVAAIAVALGDSPYAMHIAMISAFWTGTARLVRGEVIKLKSREFIEAARAIGVPTHKIMLKHLLPNTNHILLVEMTLLFISAIKSEVILSFLGLGVKDSISWGLMISEASTEVSSGHFGNFFAASVLLFILVLAFNLFSDALQDALDPKKR